MPNNSALIMKLMECNVPLTKEGKDLHRVHAEGRAVDIWLETHGQDKPLALVCSTIEGRKKLDALIYQ